MEAGRTGRTEEGIALPALPAEVWARVLNYCSFGDILASSAAEAMILKEALPLLTEITVDFPSQMNLSVAKRFRDVTSIIIHSLYSLEEDVDYKDTNVNYETQVRLVPFLSRFPQLERVTFGGKDEFGVQIENYWPLDGHFYESDESFPHEGCKEREMRVSLAHFSDSSSALTRIIETVQVPWRLSIVSRSASNRVHFLEICRYLDWSVQVRRWLGVTSSLSCR